MLSFSVHIHVERNLCQAVRRSADVHYSSCTPTRARTFSTSPPARHLGIITLRTLRPSSFIKTGQQIVDLSGRTRKTVKILFDHPRWPSPLGAIRISNLISNDQVSRFPENTRGFFYYLPRAIELAGGVRFRVCDDAAAFDAGCDLVIRDKPWEAQLVDITRCDVYHSFIPVLLRDKLVDEDLLLDAKKCQHAWNTRERFYSLWDPFILQLDQRVITCGFYSRKGCKAHRFPGLGTKDNRRLPERLHPYTGSILARFEVSQFPEHAKLGPCLILKCLDIVEPVKCIVPDYDDHVRKPTPGNYMMIGGKLWRLPLNRYLKTFRDMMEQEGLLPTK